MKRVYDALADELRSELKSLLTECTEAQNARILRSVPNGIDTASDDELRSAIAFCRRFIARNHGAI